MAAVAILIQGAVLLTALYPHLASCDQVSQFCGSGQFYEDRCYLAGSFRTNWMNVRRVCPNYRGDMAIITSQEQQDWLRSLLPYRNVWIGLHKQTADGIWKWVDDTPLNYTNWKAGHPTNSSDHSCAFLSYSDHTWQSASCGSDNDFICATTPNTPICHSGGIFFRDRCYWLYQFAVPYSLVLSKCGQIQEGSKPVIIRDGELNVYLSKVISQNIWLGLIRPHSGLPFSWLDSSSPSFVNWINGNEPGTDCAVLEQGTGVWKPARCKERHVLICALPPCDIEGSGEVDCEDEFVRCTCVTGGYCLEHRRCHCRKRFHGMVCDKAQVSVELRARSHVDEGGTIELQCHVNIPKSDYSLQMKFIGWGGRGVEDALPANRTQFNANQTENGYYEFLIHNVTTEDTGTYSCLVTTDAGKQPLTMIHAAYVKVRELEEPKKPHHKDKGDKSKPKNREKVVSTNTTSLIAALATLAVCCALLIVGLVLVLGLVLRGRNYSASVQMSALLNE